MDDLTPEDIISGRGNPVVESRVAQDVLAHHLHGFHQALLNEGFTEAAAMELTQQMLVTILDQAPE